MAEMTDRIKLTTPQRRVLANLLGGFRASSGLVGMSEMGGLTRTLWSLRRKGLLDSEDNLTEAGREMATRLK